jgi:hypothetical protein
MKQDPLTSAYLKVIEENSASGKVEGQSLKVGEPFGHSENKKNTETFYKDSGVEKAKKDVKAPVEAPAELSEDPENEPKEFKASEKLTLKDSRNPFDVLFNKIISEDSFAFGSEEGVQPEDNFGGPEGLGGHDEELSDEEAFGDEDDVEDFEEDEHEDLESLVSQLKELVGKLESHLEGHIEHEEGEEGEEFPEDSREEGEEETEHEDEDLSEEAVDAEVLGHALVDQEKLEAGHTKKTAWNVKGAVPKAGTKAEVVKGKKVTGKPEAFENKEGVSKLQAKASHDAKGVKAGKFLFDDQRGE